LKLHVFSFWGLQATILINGQDHREIKKDWGHFWLFTFVGNYNYRRFIVFSRV